MTTGPVAVVVPRELYYHEVKYVRGLETRVKELESSIVNDELRGRIAYALTKRLVIDISTARAAVDEAVKNA